MSGLGVSADVFYPEDLLNEYRRISVPGTEATVSIAKSPAPPTPTTAARSTPKRSRMASSAQRRAHHQRVRRPHHLPIVWADFSHIAVIDSFADMTTVNIVQSIGGGPQMTAHTLVARPEEPVPDSPLTKVGGDVYVVSNGS